MKILHKKIFLFIIVVLFVSACSDDFLDTEPAGIISEEQVAASPAASQAIISGVYASLRSFGIGGSTQHVDYGLMSTKNAVDMLSHDVVMDAASWFIFYMNYNGRVQTHSRTRVQWNTYYAQVLATNNIIANLSEGQEAGTNTDEENHLLGQALALRSLSYHYLIRLYAEPYSRNQDAAGIPLYDGTSFEGQPRSSVKEVYDRISTDLALAVQLLDKFTRNTTQEINQSVANGLLAEVYLDMENWTGASNAANEAREGLSLMTAEDYVKSGFSDISHASWMWGADINSESSTSFASFFSHFDAANAGYGGALGAYKQIDANLYSLISATDKRRDAFVPEEGADPLPKYVNLKFVDNSFFEGDYIYMRVAEMYLIEAEALARGGNDAQGAQLLFDLVSTRDPDYTLSTNVGSNLAEEIYLHRRIELWGEGFAWFDLKRLGKPLMRDYPGSNHNAGSLFNYEASSKNFVFQIPEDEINSNDEISASDQNP